jgi:sterol desaturase/sphingolipid hydroxylase (fatty acid hydroxylase superfamily)
MPKNFVSNKDETVRMFKSDWLEAFSRVHWTVPLIVYLPIIAYFLNRSSAVYYLLISQIVTLIIVGIIIWSFTEYTLHRFVFHYVPNNNWGRRLHFIVHGVHHDYPKDSKRLVMPPAVSIPLALLFYELFYIFFGREYVAPFFAGFLIGYLFYDTSHYAIHHFNIHNKFWLIIKNHHMKHHYQNSNLGYGVSQPTWDYIFGTTFQTKENSDYEE